MLHLKVGNKTLCNMRITPGVETTGDQLKILASVTVETDPHKITAKAAQGACRDCAAALSVTTLRPHKKQAPAAPAHDAPAPAAPKVESTK